MKIYQNDILSISKQPYDFIEETTEGGINYEQWVTFIKTHHEYFIWYEETQEGIEVLKNIDQVPDWGKERVLSSLNKKKAFAKPPLVDDNTELVVSFSTTSRTVDISLDKNPKKNQLFTLLSMAHFLNANLLLNGSTVISELAINSIKE